MKAYIVATILLGSILLTFVDTESDSYENTELKLEFSSKELAINYAKKMKINYELIEPRKRKIIKKSYADNFLNK